MRPSPFLTAIGASAGTFITLGGATFVVSGVVLSVAKRVVRARKLATAQPCIMCAGSGFRDCQVCWGKGIVRSRPPVPLKQLRRKQRPEAGGAAPEPVLCSCPACGTTRLQRCLNCIGEGRVCLPT